MDNFTYHNPTKIVFGKGSIAQLEGLLPSGGTVLMTYGKGSIKKNGVYDQVLAAAKGRRLVEFAGIEPNPRYETCMRAVELARREKAVFLLSVGGGSVLDGTKFIAAATRYSGADPWDILAKGAPIKDAIPIGCVLTLPATGSEMNANSVISRDSTGDKLYFSSGLVRPVFSILDPETTFSLPVVLPGVWQHQQRVKKAKLLQFGERVLGVKRGTPAARVAQVIGRTERFFNSLGVKTRLAAHGIPAEACSLVAKRLAARGMKLGERQAIGPKEVEAILRSRV